MKELFKCKICDKPFELEYTLIEKEYKDDNVLGLTETFKKSYCPYCGTKHIWGRKAEWWN